MAREDSSLQDPSYIPSVVNGYFYCLLSNIGSPRARLSKLDVDEFHGTFPYVSSRKCHVAILVPGFFIWKMSKE